MKTMERLGWSVVKSLPWIQVGHGLVDLLVAIAIGVGIFVYLMP